MRLTRYGMFNLIYHTYACMMSIMYKHAYYLLFCLSVFVYGAGYVYVEEVFCEAIFHQYTGSMAMIYSDKCRMDTMWCVGLGGCFIPHMVCWDGRSWCVEDRGRTMHIGFCMFLSII
ncbi:hypothetical protein V6Z11_A06G094300 [Gossypium hirsutum]